MAFASVRMTPDTLAEATSGGCSWLAEQAVQGRLCGTSAPLRRLAWLHLLGVIDGDDPEKWASALEVGRGKYNVLVDGHRKETNIGSLDPNVCNPLARGASNPFNKVHASDELMKEIWKDVERTFPEVPFLSSTESRKTLQRLLFHYCRSTSPSKDVADSYRQGMNELAAVLFAACKIGEMSETGWDTGESLHERLVGARHTEADAFTLFGRLMKMGLRPMFTPNGGARVSGPAGPAIGDLPSSRPLAQPDAPVSAILARCMFIFDTLVKAGDAPLHAHLKKLEIEPQLFMLRWLRLLFSREYSLEETLLLWDGLFADAGNRTQEPAAFKYPDPGHGKGAVAWKEAAKCSSAMPLVDFVAAASLRAMRRDLMSFDQTDCLRHLLSAKAPSCGMTAILDAARKLRQTAPTKPEDEVEGTPRAAADPQPPRSHISSAARAGGRPAAEAGAAGGRAVNGFTPNGGGTRPGLNAPPRGQQLVSAVGQGVQGFWGAATQAVQNISEQFDQPPGAGAAPDSVEEWRMRALQAEQERDTIRRKANEFVIVKKKEWAAEAEQLQRALADRDEQIAERDARIAHLEHWIQEAANAEQGVQNVDLGDGLFD